MSNPYPFRRTVTLSKGSNFHQAHPGSSGPVRIPMKRSLVPTDDPHCYRDDELDSFKASIYRFGYASCPASHCRLSFLSLAGIVAHKKNCAGFLRQGDFVTCSFCEVRFCQFRSLRTHQERSHGVPPLHPSEISPAHESLDSKKPILNENMEAYETREEQNSRLMAESRIASNARPRGRPGKYTEVRRETNEDFYELDYSYYSRHSSRYVLLDNEPEEELSPSSASPPRIMKVRTTDGNILYVRPIAGVSGEQKEEENWSSSSSTSGSARSALKSYNDKSRRAHVGSSLESVDYDDDVKIEEEVSCTSRNSSSSSSNASKKNSLEEQRAILEAYEEIVLRSEALAENAKKKIREKNELLKKEKDFKSWEEELRRREAKAQQTINEALFTLGSDSLDCTKEEDISHSPPSRRSAVVIDLCDDLDTHETNESYILPDSTRSVRSAGSTFSASSSSINEDNLSDSISLVASLAKESNVYSSPEPINAPPPLSTPDLSDASVAEPNRQKMISDQGDLTISSNGSNGDNLNSNCSTLKKQKSSIPRILSKKNNIRRTKRLRKSGRSTNSLQRQLQQFLSSIDTSSLKTRRTCDASIEDSNSRLDLEDTQSLNINRQPSSSQGVGRIKVIKPVKIPANAEPSNIKSTPSGVKYILPSNMQSRSSQIIDSPIQNNGEHSLVQNESEHTPIQNESELIHNRIHKSRNELISELIDSPSGGKSSQSFEEVISSDLPICYPNNEDYIVAEEEAKEVMDSPDLTQEHSNSPTDDKIDLEEHKISLSGSDSEETTTVVENTDSLSIQIEEVVSNSNLIQEPLETPKRTRRKKRTSKASYDKTSPSNTKKELRRSTRIPRVQNTPSIIEPELPKMERNKRQCTTTPRVQNTPPIIDPESSKKERNKRQCTTTTKGQNTPSIIEPESPKKERNKRQCTTKASGQNTQSIIEPELPKMERKKRQCTTTPRVQNTPSIIEPESQKNEQNKRQSTTTPRVQNTLSIIEPESQKMERNITQCTSTPLSKMTTKKTVTVGKRKRAIQLKDKLEATPDSKSSKSPPTKKAKVSPQLKCGKCDTIFESSQQFNVHVASRHGGVARLAGESQEFSNEEIQVSIKQAFRLVKKVLCYICGGSSFTTRLGLQYHIQRCGKTREELEAEMVPCSHCKYRGLPSGLKMHMKTHWELTEPTEVTHEENIDESLDVSSSGRVRRSAACKADKIMNETINSLLIIGEDGDVKNDKEDIDDEEYVVSKDINVEDKFKKINSKLFRCTLCDFENKTRKSLVNHVLSAHSEEDEDQDHEDEFFEDEENSSDSADECDAIISRTPGARQSKPRHYNSTGRCPTLSPCMEHLKSELKFRIAHFSVKETLFRKIMSNEFQPVTNSSEADSYLPTSKHSISFTYKKSVDSQFSSKVTSLARFEGTILDGIPTFFAGGPIWTLEWAPHIGEGEEFFAVCTHRDMDDVSAMFSLDFGLGVIQIWSSGVLKATCENASAPIFKYGILHDYGKIWCFKWCPSGTDTETDLGLLAAGCSNGNVYIHRIQRPKHDDVNKADSSPQFYKHAPEVCLRPLRESFGQCLKIAWYNGKEHRVIGAAYSEGKIALYDLLTSSILLKRGSVIHPYKVLHVHTSCVNALDLLGNDVFPRYCATGSFDRHFNVWDLNEPSFPILNGKKGLITDLHFFRSFSDGHISISHDDVYLQSHTQTILSEPGYSRVRTQPILCHNSAIKNEATNFWLGTLGVGTSAGEVIVFVSPSNASSLETDKYTTRRRTFVYRTSVSHKDNDKSSLKYEECKDNIEEFGYVDMNLDDFRKNPDSEISATRSADRLQLEDITRYPISAINRVSFNPNLRSCTWLLSGSQNGIGRLHNIRALQHVSYTTFLKTYIETFENRE